MVRVADIELAEVERVERSAAERGGLYGVGEEPTRSERGGDDWTGRAEGDHLVFAKVRVASSSLVIRSAEALVSQSDRGLRRSPILVRCPSRCPSLDSTS